MNTDMKHVITLDIGGSHITAAVVNATTKTVYTNTIVKESFDSNEEVGEVLSLWKKVIHTCFAKADVQKLEGLAFCMPGPFDYEKGICWIKDQSKYEKFYGVDVKKAILEKMELPADFPVYFQNDADSFGIGEVYQNPAFLDKKVIAITLGTGLGACFIDHGNVVLHAVGVPKDGEIYNLPYKDTMAEDYVSARGLLRNYNNKVSQSVQNGLNLYELAVRNDALAIAAFQEFGKDLAAVLLPLVQEFQAEALVFGGKIADGKDFFLPELQSLFAAHGLQPSIAISNDNEKAALLGAANLFLAETLAEM